MNQNLSAFYLKILLTAISTVFVCCDSNVGEEIPICIPECSYGYDCVINDGEKTCTFSTTLIIIIVVLSIVGVVVVAAGIFFLCLCYCAAFNQPRLSRFFIKPQTQSEVERDRLKYLEKIKKKKRPVYPANYFDELRRCRLEEQGIMEECTGSNGSSLNEKPQQPLQQHQQKPHPQPIERSKSMLEIFPPATLTKTNQLHKNDASVEPIIANQKRAALSPANNNLQRDENKPATSPGQIQQEENKPAISPGGDNKPNVVIVEKAVISPGDKIATSPARM